MTARLPNPTEYQSAMLLQMHSERYTRIAIAKAIGVSRYQVKVWYQRLGLSSQERAIGRTEAKSPIIFVCGTKNKAKSARRVRKIVSSLEEPIRRVSKTPPSKTNQRPFTKTQDRLIAILAGKGFTSGEVAERLNRTETSIKHRAIKIGVSFAPKGLYGSWVGFLTASLT